MTVLAAILLAAQSLLGLTAEEIGASSHFWCQNLVNAATGQAWSGPTDIKRNIVPFAPVPGGIVTSELFHANDTPEHAAIIEQVHEDGSLTVIQGNGTPDTTRVTRTVILPQDIHSTGITVDAHQEYLYGLCVRLQEVKYWIDWKCHE